MLEKGEKKKKCDIEEVYIIVISDIIHLLIIIVLVNLVEF